MKTVRSIIIVILFSICSFGQGYVLLQRNNIPVLLNNDTLVNAWAGGINSSTISTFDFNKDNIQDILLFDRQHSRNLVFIIKSGRPIFSPEFSETLPKLSMYALFHDYDLDGKKDLFTSSTSGIKVFRNISLGTETTFKIQKEGLLTKYFNSLVNMDISTIDVPAFSDLDNDGDMDILHFKASQGTSIDLEKNMSKETFGKTDSLLFKNLDNCWGGLMENSCKAYNFGYDCKLNFRLQHAGAGSVLAFNGDNDLDKDLILAKEDCFNNVYMENKGSQANAVFSKSNASYPITAPVKLPYPLSFFEDGDGDNVKDLIVTMGLPSPSDTNDLKRDIWFYKNIGTDQLPDFSFQTTSFIQNTMIDLGRNAVPAFIDLDGDNDLDMLISNSASHKKGSSISSFINTGSSIKPVFSLSDTNYLSLEAQGYDEMKISTADLNNDNKKDLILNYSNNTILETSWCENKAVTGFSPNAFKPLNVSLKSPSSMCFYDIDDDGFTDLLAGTNDSLKYFKHNKNESNPSFDLVNNNYGGISSNTPFITGSFSSAIADLNKDSKPDLLTVDNSGKMQFYPSFQEQNQFNFKGIEVLSTNNTTTTLGKNLSLMIAELMNDNKPEIFMGNQNGGVMLFEFSGIINGIAEYQDAYQNQAFRMFPNPSGGNVSIVSNEDLDLTITDLSGKIIFKTSLIENQEFEIENLRAGLYFVFSENKDGKRVSQKLLIK